MGVGVFFLFLGIHRNIRMDMVSKILNISNFENLIATSVPKSLDLLTPPPTPRGVAIPHNTFKTNAACIDIAPVKITTTKTIYIENRCYLHGHCTEKIK